MSVTPSWLAALEALLNRRIEESPRAREAARRLEGTALELDIERLRVVRVTVRGARVLIEATRREAGEGLSADAASADQRPCDVRIRGTPGSLLGLGLRFSGVAAPQARAGGAVGADGNAPGNGVRIEGDAEAAARFRELLREARPDPEDELARLIGDAPARGVARLARAGLGWMARGRRALGDNLVEYLTEERRALVGRGELEEFLLEVDRVRDAADRIEARLRRLESLGRGGKP